MCIIESGIHIDGNILGALIGAFLAGCIAVATLWWERKTKLDEEKGRVAETIKVRRRHSLREALWRTAFMPILGWPASRSLGEGWWSQQGSNLRPLACHASALPTELWPHGSVKL